MRLQWGCYKSSRLLANQPPYMSNPLALNPFQLDLQSTCPSAHRPQGVPHHSWIMIIPNVLGSIIQYSHEPTQWTIIYQLYPLQYHHVLVVNIPINDYNLQPTVVLRLMRWLRCGNKWAKVNGFDAWFLSIWKCWGVYIGLHAYIIICDDINCTYVQYNCILWFSLIKQKRHNTT